MDLCLSLPSGKPLEVTLLPSGTPPGGAPGHTLTLKALDLGLPGAGPALPLPVTCSAREAGVGREAPPPGL